MAVAGQRAGRISSLLFRIQKTLGAHRLALGHCRLTDSPARTNVALFIHRAVRLIILRVADLEKRLLLFHLGDLLFQLLDPFLQALILQPQDIKPIEKVLTLDLRPFEGAFEPGQFQLSRSLVKWRCHRHPRTGTIGPPTALYVVVRTVPIRTSQE